MASAYVKAGATVNRHSTVSSEGSMGAMLRLKRERDQQKQERRNEKRTMHGFYYMPPGKGASYLPREMRAC